MRAARDEAQARYAHTRQRVVSGQASARELDKARAAYMLAQSEYRDALIKDRKTNGGESNAR